jgi:hypothetical protein
MAQELEHAGFHYYGPFTVSGTPFALCFANNLASDRYITRNGARDENLTCQLHARFSSHPAFALSSTTQRKIATWLREVWASEQPKRWERVLHGADLYIALNGQGALHDVEAYAENSNNRFRVVIEEVRE